MDMNMDMNMDMSNIVGPISSEYCTYFYILAIFKLGIFVLILVGLVYTGIQKKHSFEFYVLTIILSLGYLLSYLENRLLFNMCGNSM